LERGDIMLLVSWRFKVEVTGSRERIKGRSSSGGGSGRFSERALLVLFQITQVRVSALLN
jgi:hypothetical protein